MILEIDIVKFLSQWAFVLFITWTAFKIIEKETGFKKDDWTE